ncbi:MAG: DNA integrity scanning protein DisA nucleotide-binding domain protein [Planctomycetia bacterium]|nr:DNA integrity scanning protein DisA nucleotide-binding domain protein [Planctomycetia bacterium]
MRAVSRRLVQHAHALAREISAGAVVVNADAIEADEDLRQLLRTVDYRTILISRSVPAVATDDGHRMWVVVPNVRMTRTGQVKVAVLICLAKGILDQGDRVVCLSGIDGSGIIDMLMVLNLGSEAELFTSPDALNLCGSVNPEVFERVLTLSSQLAVEGREGRPVGGIFVVGDSEHVLAQSRSLILNPLHGYSEDERNILDPRMEETLKQFSAIDGAFVVRDDGVVLGAGVHLTPSAQGATLPSGLGTRHAAAAAITASTNAVAVAISESTGMVSVFRAGQMVADIHKPSNGWKEPT